MSRKRTGSVNKRTRARGQVLQMLFSLDFVGDDADLPRDAAEVMDGVVVENYAVELLEGVVSNRGRIDSVIEDASDNWAISRMAPTDRAILRIAVFEMLCRPDIPPSVSINEAVELAQSFGGEDESYRFVNGVLGRVASQLSAAGPTPDDDVLPERTGSDSAPDVDERTAVSDETAGEILESPEGLDATAEVV